MPWHEPQPLENQLPFPLEVQPRNAAQAESMQAAAIQRQIHAEQMRTNPQGTFQLLGSGLFKNLNMSHLATGVLGILAGAAAGYYVGNVIMAPKSAKAKANGRRRKKAPVVEADDDLDPDTWDDEDEGEDEDGEDE